MNWIDISLLLVWENGLRRSGSKFDDSYADVFIPKRRKSRPPVSYPSYEEIYRRFHFTSQMTIIIYPSEILQYIHVIFLVSFRRYEINFKYVEFSRCHVVKQKVFTFFFGPSWLWRNKISSCVISFLFHFYIGLYYFFFVFVIPSFEQS